MTDTTDTTNTPGAMTTTPLNTITDDAKMNDTLVVVGQKAPPPAIRSPPLAPPSSFKHPTMSSRRGVPPRTADSPVSPIEVTTPEVDQSFMRWSTTSEAFSEAGLSTWSYHPHSAVSNTAASRDSSGTYAIGPDSATSRTDLGTVPEGRSSFDTFGAGARQRSNQDVSGGSMGSGRSASGKSRPVSMSSVSGSLYHGALAELGKFDTGLREKAEEETPKRVKEPVNQMTLKGSEQAPSNLSPSTQHLDRSATVAQEDDEEHQDQVSFSLTPPPRGHRSAASVQLAELPSIRESSPAVHRMAVYSPRHRTRSKSIDTISVEHSISDSVTGLLLPANHNVGRIPPVHPSTLSTELVSKNDLNPGQRAVLLRRAKKLEQLLGQSLDERSIERLLIDPIHQVRTVTTQADEEVWPSTPLGGRNDREWQREDCAPRKGKQVDTSTSVPGLARSGSVLAKRARAALGLDGKSKTAPRGDLAVYVSREMRVSETAVRGVKPVRDSISSPPAAVVQHHIKRNMPISPKSILDDMDEDIDEDEVLRRKRRLQLAKLHRLLGVHVPLSLVMPQGASLRQGAIQSEPNRVDDSFMSFEDNVGAGGANWATKFKSAVNAVRPSREGTPTPVTQPPSPDTPQDETFVDMMEVMTDKEKAVARKKAQKLEYMFGDAPPQNLFLPLRPATPLNVTENNSSMTDGGSDRQSSSAPYETYERSLKELLYLADNDPPSLDILMDQLDDPLPGSRLTRRKTISPRSPSTSFFPSPPNILDPDSYDARRKRTGKLSHFFGETGIDFTDPPNVEDTMDKVKIKYRSQKRSSMRRETLDSMMREMWKGVQGEVKRGSMAIPDGEKLGEMIERLRKRRGSVGQWEAL